MIPKDCKRLAEVDFPIAAVSAHAAREKSIRHGHPSTLHLWWARRPLAACRSMLMALLLPDPGDPHCPAEFKKKARELLRHVPGARDSEATDDGLRRSLLRFIADFANWDNAANALYLNAARGLVRAAHGDEAPLVVDPFAGGGSIPLEALRLGCEAFASDLNPVACLINKVLLEDIPRHGPELADQLREASAKVKKAAEAELASFYPPDPDGGKPIAYLWARTVRCESSGCGAEIPLMKSFWLSKKENRRRALRPVEPCKPPFVAFEVFTPTTEADVRGGTVSRATATCLCCGKSLRPDRVRAQLAAQRGGADVIFDVKGKRTGGARLLAVVRLKDGVAGRDYRIAAEKDYAPVRCAQERVKQLAEKRTDGMSVIPDEPIPRTELRRISLPIYGINRFAEMFTSRQLYSLTRLASNLVKATEGSPATNRLLSLSLGKTADLNNANSRWEPVAQCPRQTLARHDIPMAWDFAEAVPIGDSSGSLAVIIGNTASSITPSFIPGGYVATLQNADACTHPLPGASASVWFTDPPYYDAVPYAHLADFFHIWHRRSLAGSGRSPLALCPKAEECVADRPHKLIPEAKTAKHFEARMGLAMAEGQRVTAPTGIGCIVFAHKTTEGWEALLTGMISGGWTITGSWPIATEMASRLNARENASLATSVHLVCRPRAADAPDGDWSQVQRELVGRIDAWMKRLQAEGVRGADLVFACIGPALEVYSKHPRVLDSEDRPIPLGGNPEATEPHDRGFLAYVWELVGKAALAQVLKEASGSAAGLEPDARLTALFLWTLQATATKAAPEPIDPAEDADEDITDDEDEDDAPTGGKKAKGFSLAFDVARRFSQPLGIRLNEWENRIIETKKGVVRLLPVGERAEQLFGKDGPATATESAPNTLPRGAGTPAIPGTVDEKQPSLPGTVASAPLPAPTKKTRTKKATAAAVVPHERTTLDRVHTAMLLQSSGQTAALKSLLADELARGPEFLRLANALYPLYPDGCDEKRLLQALLLAAPKK